MKVRLRSLHFKPVSYQHSNRLFQAAVISREVDNTARHYTLHTLHLNKIFSDHKDRDSSSYTYRGADKSLARPTSLCILSDGENISFDANVVIYIYIYLFIFIYI